jgi:hypothetical protein
MKYFSILAFISSCLLLDPTVNADDWRQFRGVNANGLSDDPQLPKTWNETENIRWKVDLPGDA